MEGNRTMMNIFEVLEWLSANPDERTVKHPSCGVCFLAESSLVSVAGNTPVLLSSRTAVDWEKVSDEASYQVDVATAVQKVCDGQNFTMALTGKR
jgi:hypothetical protein